MMKITFGFGNGATSKRIVETYELWEAMIVAITSTIVWKSLIDIRALKTQNQSCVYCFPHEERKV